MAIPTLLYVAEYMRFIGRVVLGCSDDAGTSEGCAVLGGLEKHALRVYSVLATMSVGCNGCAHSSVALESGCEGGIADMGLYDGNLGSNE